VQKIFAIQFFCEYHRAEFWSSGKRHNNAILVAALCLGCYPTSILQKRRNLVRFFVKFLPIQTTLTNIYFSLPIMIIFYIHNTKYISSDFSLNEWIIEFIGFKWSVTMKSNTEILLTFPLQVLKSPLYE
jgi:hypothetical protein